MISTLAYILSFISYIRNFMYNNKFLKIHKFPIPVISIGNLTFGGTGKTPATIDIAKYILSIGHKPGIVSRGYKKSGRGTVIVSDGVSIKSNIEQAGDEAMLIAHSLNDVPIIVDSNKVNAINYILNYNIDVVIIDDGFQSRYIHRDLDIVLINLTQHNPINGRTLSKNILRESIVSLSRADIIATSRNSNINAHKWIAGNFSSIICNPIEKFNVIQKTDKSISKLKKRNLIGFAGIGDPGSFRQPTIGYTIEKYIVFKDHSKYRDKEIKKLLDAKDRCNASGFLTTYKDFIKLPLHFLDSQDVFILSYSFEISKLSRVRKSIKNIL